MPSSESEVIIVGAGVSGLLLAQNLRKCGISYQIFERDTDLTTRGLGWGLTLHWSLPALRQLLPDELLRRIPETYVDRASVEEGRASTFPFFNLSTSELKAATPPAPESQRIRMARDRFRELIATGIDIQVFCGAKRMLKPGTDGRKWSKAATTFESKDGSVTVHFDDGSSATSRLLVACDGGNSRVRQALFPERQSYNIPIRFMGVKAEYTPEQMEPLRKLDPIFLQGTASANDTYTFISGEHLACLVLCVGNDWREMTASQSSTLPETIHRAPKPTHDTSFNSSSLGPSVPASSINPPRRRSRPQRRTVLS